MRITITLLLVLMIGCNISESKKKIDKMEVQIEELNRKMDKLILIQEATT